MQYRYRYYDDEQFEDFREPTADEKAQQAAAAAKRNEAEEFAKATGKPALYGGLLYGRDGKSVAMLFDASNPSATAEVSEWVRQLGGLVVE